MKFLSKVNLSAAAAATLDRLALASIWDSGGGSCTTYASETALTPCNCVLLRLEDVLNYSIGATALRGQLV